MKIVLELFSHRRRFTLENSTFQKWNECWLMELRYKVCWPSACRWESWAHGWENVRWHQVEEEQSDKGLACIMSDLSNFEVWESEWFHLEYKVRCPGTLWFLSEESGVWTRWTLRFLLPLQKLETLEGEAILLGFSHNSRGRRRPPFRWTSCTGMSRHGQGPASLGWMFLAAGHQGLTYLVAEAMGFMLLKGAWLPLHHRHHSVTWWLKFQNRWKISWG